MNLIGTKKILRWKIWTIQDQFNYLINKLFYLFYLSDHNKKFENFIKRNISREIKYSTIEIINQKYIALYLTKVRDCRLWEKKGDVKRYDITQAFILSARKWTAWKNSLSLNNCYYWLIRKDLHKFSNRKYVHF